MPARINKIRHDENTRMKIKAANIIDRLEKLVAGQIEMPPHAVTAALGLLRKCVPDLTSVEHSGEISTTKVIRTPTIQTNIDAWQKQYADQPEKLN